MGKGYELEKRVLAMISEQYEGIYQLNLADKKVICIYDGRDAWGTDDVLDRDIWRDRLVLDFAIRKTKRIYNLFWQRILFFC